jgi:hypothetical protein
VRRGERLRSRMVAGRFQRLFMGRLPTSLASIGGCQRPFDLARTPSISRCSAIFRYDIPPFLRCRTSRMNQGIAVIDLERVGHAIHIVMSRSRMLRSNL